MQSNERIHRRHERIILDQPHESIGVLLNLTEVIQGFVPRDAIFVHFEFIRRVKPVGHAFLVVDLDELDRGMRWYLIGVVIDHDAHIHVGRQSSISSEFFGELDRFRIGRSSQVAHGTFLSTHTLIFYAVCWTYLIKTSSFIQ